MERMTNTQILKTADKRLLTGLDSQRRYLLEIALAPTPCPNCGVSVSKIDASGKGLDDYPVNESKDDGYVCTNCKVELHWCVPFLGSSFWMTERAYQGMTSSKEASDDRRA